MTRSLNLTKPLEESDDKIQHGVADLVLRDVSGKNAGAGKLSSSITTTWLIPNELLQSLGQLGNEASRTRSQSLLNIINLIAKSGIRTFNRIKQLLNFIGEGLSTILASTRTTMMDYITVLVSLL
ncbi:uncharacterized protein BcabD6B2_20220 [Babesia caballi]|uniref:Uncharacterized protein n=1 Tax=Babesia caballi TaxID=5871 RepID=A0AAV4LQR7_BABCB|nr:hypothetical protein, conserved [Babesia caballi]